MKEFYKSRFFVVFFLSAFFCISIGAQEDFDPKEFFIEAESYFLFEEFPEALPLYQRILSKEPQNYNVMYKIGICYLNDPYQKHRSLKYLTEASEHINPKFKTNNYKEKQAPPDVLYYLGQSHRVNGNIDEAIKYYTAFKNSVDPEVYNLDVVNAELASCEVAKKITKSPVYSKKKNLGDMVNSRFADIRPVLSGDGKTLVFTRELQFYDAIFITTLDSNGTWSPPYNLTPDFGLDGNSYTTCISYHGDQIFVYRSDNYDGNIYSSKRMGIRWQPLKKLNDNINTKYWESHASISPDGQTLYFTSNRKGGYGGLDIYRSTLQSNGEWGEAINLGPVVNSAYNDDTPFISPNDNKLYFSSLGHDGMGGYDIFVTERIGADKWVKPVNMGYPLNTTDDDLFFAPVAVGEYAGLYSQYYQETTYGLMDIYWVEVYNDILPRTYTVKGNVNAPNPELFAGGNLVASLVDNKAGKIVAQTNIDSLGGFALDAPQGDYQLLVDGQGINPASVPVVLSLTQDNSDVELALITAVATEAGKTKAVLPPATLPLLTINTEQYIMTDSMPVSIDLNVEEGSDLRVENFADNKLKSTEDFHVTKSRFTYLLNPQPGENKLIITVTDGRGNINQEEVFVYYTPQPEEGEEMEEQAESFAVPEPTALPEIALLAPIGLQAYLKTLGDVDYSSKGELYNMLIANAQDNNYTEEEVNELFAVMLTQRDKDEFIKALETTQEFDNKRLPDTILDDLNIPLAIVKETRNNYSDETNEINTGLTTMIPFSGSSEEEALYILSFVGKDFTGKDDTESNTSEELLKTISDVAGSETEKAVDLASTTQGLDYYYQNLLASSDDEMKEYLSGIDFEEAGIRNSVELVNYLFATASENNISTSELIYVLETAQNKKEGNLYKFKESLASGATGDLKMAIEDIDFKNNSVDTYEAFINQLISQSKTANYSPYEVYELLLDMLGIEKVEELAEAMTEKSSSEIDSLLGATNMQQFSKPVELVQFLISQSPYFDYTESEINNLLLRMLLEKGIDTYIQDEESLQSKKLIRKRRLITTIVLVNALLLVLLFIFWRRKKKNQNE